MNKKKKVLVTAVVVCMIAILSFSTLAWFTDNDKVTNTFKISDSLTSFEVDVWEEVDTNGDGDSNEVGKGSHEENEGVDGATYTDVVPGVEYLKKVHVQNTSDNTMTGQYIKAEVTFTNYAALHAMVETEAPFDCTTMLEQGRNFSSSKNSAYDWWYNAEETAIDTEANTVTYTFYLKKVLNDEDDVVLFENVKLPETMDINDADYLIHTGGFNIQVVAYAIQSANIKAPEGETEALDLEDVLYAFGTEWANRNTAPADPTLPSTEAEVTE